jgi:surface antigen
MQHMITHPLKWLQYKLDHIDMAIEESENELLMAERQMEDVLDILVANSEHVRFEFDLDEVEWAKNLQQDLKESGYTMISGYQDLDIDRLLTINPDIASKGVTYGMNGEPWDPHVQEQCTFYAAARRTQIGRPLPVYNVQTGLWGNAGNWANKAALLGMTVDKTPERGDVFCIHGTYGHVGVVEYVAEDGNIMISEGNYQYNGEFNSRVITPQEYSTWDFIK